MLFFYENAKVATQAEEELFQLERQHAEADEDKRDTIRELQMNAKLQRRNQTYSAFLTERRQVLRNN